MKYDRPKDDLREAMENAYRRELPVIEENMSFLSTIIQVAPLLGLVGTLLGMMRILLVVQLRTGSSLALGVGDIAPHLWQALLCSVAGFLVAIFCLVAYNFLCGKIKSLEDTMEQGAAELVAFFMERRMSL